MRTAVVAVVAVVAMPLLTLSAARARAQVVVDVADEESGQPLIGAQVRIRELGLTARTVSLGVARFANVPAGAFTVQARMLGYAPISALVLFSGHDSTEVVLLMERAAATLPAVVSTAPLSDSRLEPFERHRARGIGHFLIPADFWKDRLLPIEDIVWSKIPGLQLVWVPDDFAYELASTRGARVCAYAGSSAAPSASSGGSLQARCGGPCFVDVYIDGVHQLVPDITYLLPEQIAGIEYYSMNEAPVEWRTANSDCGVLAIWTK